MSTEGQLPPVPLLKRDGVARSDAVSPISRSRGKTISVARRTRPMPRLLVLADIVGLTGAFLLSVYFLPLVRSEPALVRSEVALAVLMLPAWLVGAKFSGLYDRDEERVAHSTADDLMRVFLLATVSVFLVTQVVALLLREAPGVFGLASSSHLDVMKSGLFWVLAMVFVAGARVGARAFAARRGFYRQPTIIVGAGEAGRLVARKLIRHKEYRINLVGFVDGHRSADRPDEAHDVPILVGPNDEAVPLLGGLDLLASVVEQFSVERVIFAVSDEGNGHLLELVRKLRDSGVHVDIVPPLYEVIGPKSDLHTVEAVSVLGLPPVRLSCTAQWAKRSIDIVGAALGLALTAPFFVLAALLIKTTSPGPVFFRQTRLGKDMRRFTLLKFRTMKVDTDERVHQEFIAATMRSERPPTDGGLFKLARDSDVTPFGRWLRRTSLDELPQLINVLRGDMSLVGPRPCIPYEVSDFKPHHFDRFLVPAGMTGLWQTSARAYATYAEALDMDALYAQSWSLGLDLLLLARTPAQLLTPRTTR